MLLRTSKKNRDEERDEGALPLPTQIVSNGEYWPIPQTRRQRMVEDLLLSMADERARKLGLSRRGFLRTAAGTATALVAINIVSGCGDDGQGGGFAVDDCATRDPAAARELFESDFFVMDVQTHHVDLDGPPGMNPALGEFFRSFRFCNPDAIAADTCHPGVLGELSRANFLKEVFLDSETAVAIMSGIPAPSRSLQALSNEAMATTRDVANELGASQRMLTQGMLTPNFPPGNDAGTNISDMERLVNDLNIVALKTYTGAGGGLFGPDAPPWWLDDEEVSYPMLAEAERLGIHIINTHKGLRLGIFDAEHIKPRDIPKVATDWPQMDFVIYHSAGEFLDDLVALKVNQIPDATNVYSELGSIFATNVISDGGIDAVGHLLGKLVNAFGADHVIWGTDSIWWGSPQWQIAALKTFRMPQHLMEEFGYPEITDEIKAQIFGLNAALLYGIDPDAMRCTVPPELVPSSTATPSPTPTLGVPAGTTATPTPLGTPAGTTAARMDGILRAKREYASIATPSLRTYGPRTRREFLRFLGKGNPLA